MVMLSESKELCWLLPGVQRKCIIPCSVREHEGPYLNSTAPLEEAAGPRREDARPPPGREARRPELWASGRGWLGPEAQHGRELEACKRGSGQTSDRTKGSKQKGQKGRQ